jgi:hypothetical protein
MFTLEHGKAFRIILDVAIAALFLAAAGCAHQYSAKPTLGFIIDAETRQPVEGAVVVAHWDLEYGLEGSSTFAWVVMEAVTDRQGRFDFAGWGPRKVPDFLPSEARLKDRDPRVVFFKVGYQGIAQTQSQADKDYARPHEFPTRGASVREWYLNGETFHYRPAKNDAKRLAQEVQSFNLVLEYMRGPPCLFFDIPRSFLAFKKAYEQVIATEAGKAAFRYGRPAHEKWLADYPQVQAMQKQECGMTAREALEKVERKHDAGDA